MNISYNWLKTFLKFEYSPEEVGKILTDIGLEVEAIEPFESLKGGLANVVIGKVLTCEKHPNADKLSKTTVDVGSQILPIVCGAPNVGVGQKVIVALPNAVLYTTDGEPFTIKKSKIRGEESEGMICAEDEIGLGKSHDGIMVLQTDLPAGTPAAQYFEIETDYTIIIGLTPNRVDAASHLGVARDLYAALCEQKGFTGQFTNHNFSNFKSDNQTDTIEIKVLNKNYCPRYAGLTLKNITVKPSPNWLQNRLKSIGLHPINNVVDATNFVLHELGQPLHAFDLAKVKGNKIIVKFAEKDTVFTTLDGKEIKLTATDLVICNENEPMCLAGVFGGLHSGVSESTTSIFLESAYFHPDNIRKTSQYHGLKTDSSFRFERGTDPNMVIFALKRAALLIKEIAGGEISSDIIDVYPDKIENFAFQVSYQNIRNLIGVDISQTKIFSILDALEISSFNESKEGFWVSVPPYRVDVQREADIIEEIVRIYGFNNIPSSDNLGSTFLSNFPQITRENVINSIANLLSANGFNEIMTNSLTRSEYAASIEDLDAKQSVEILNKLSPELGVMRQSMLFSGLESVLYNINRKQKNLKFYEFGNVYRKKAEGNEVKDFEETAHLALFITGNAAQESWKQKSAQANFHDLAEAIQKVLFQVNISGYQTKNEAGSVFLQGLAFEKNTKTLVRFGQIKSKLTKIVDIKQPVFYAEFNMDVLYKMVSSKLIFNEIAKFPEVRRDLSLVIDKKITFEEIEKVALKTEKKILKEINVFDIYEGEKLGANKKSYSVSFNLLDSEQTLSDKQIETTMNRLIDAFEKELGALIRV
ncbi:MAG: phenylalanine--tRNA ligase subunit beta [Bacteroidetes bacterium]|nr:MAG: phenylalanine--tRNA ligase subunit beta [Bacteroidota bacterium]